jgi:hypothetical protein
MTSNLLNLLDEVHVSAAAFQSLALCSCHSFDALIRSGLRRMSGSLVLVRSVGVLLVLLLCLRFCRLGCLGVLRSIVLQSSSTVR